MLDVAHSRISGALPLGDVDVAVSLETRGPEHIAELVRRAAGAARGHRVVRPPSGPDRERAAAAAR